MPSEAQMWTALRPHMEDAKLDPIRVENPALPGTPDVNYIEGWIELKHADQWPARGGPLRLKHPPTPEQKVFLYRRCRAGGNATLLLRVGQEWFVFPGSDVREVWAGNTPPDEETIRRMAHRTFTHPSRVAAFYADNKNGML